MTICSSLMLIGNNIVNILGTSLATLMCVRILGEENGASVSTVIMTIVVLVFGEVTPKSVAKEVPEQFAMFSAPFMNMLTKILTPLNFLFAQWKKLLAKLFQMENDHGITEEELLTFVEEAKEDGGIDEQEGRLIRNAVEFTERDVMDIGTPRVDVIGVPEDAELTEIDQVFAETMFSRLPVYRENIDCIVGIIYQKDLFKGLSQGRKTRRYHPSGALCFREQEDWFSVKRASATENAHRCDCR
ncbi:MAG: CNNM domain-containing protein [Lachnospiraceae bacterium]